MSSNADKHESVTERLAEPSLERPEANPLQMEYLALLNEHLRREKTDAPRSTSNEKPKEEEKSLDYRDSKVTLKLRDGKGFYFKGPDGEWDSKGGEIWIQRKSNGLNSFRGAISFDEDGNCVIKNKDYGTKRILGTNGSESLSITTDAGKSISITRSADGKAVFAGTKGTWKSDDGLNWKNGDQVFTGQLGIDAEGQYWSKPAGSDTRQISTRSSEISAIQKKMSDMKGSYNISFGAAGTKYEYEYKDPQTDAYVKVPVNFRHPTMNELNILDKSLQQYKHIAKAGDNADFNGLKFSFISGSGEGKKVGLYGWYNSNKDGVSQIFFAPRNSLQPASAWEGLRGTALHEIGHHLQHRLWDKGTGRETPQKVMDAFGFSYDKTAEKYRLKDKDDNLWQREETRDKDKSGAWEYRGRWYPVVKDTVIKEESRALTSKQMADKLPAERKPCTNYFTYPTEAHAEALSMYLFDRQMLWDRNQKLYANTKAWDQADLNKYYGVKEGDGTPVMMRSTDGKIVPNNAANRGKVKEQEDSWRTKKPTETKLRSQWQESVSKRDEIYSI